MAKNVSEEDALDYVLGYTVGNDVRRIRSEWVGMSIEIFLASPTENRVWLCLFQNLW